MQGSHASGESFERAARSYDEVRPGYPDELVEEIIRSTRIADKARILEIGCGTGQATILFARRGYAMLCLDIGENLIALARERCKDYPRVEFLKASFEDWEASVKPFDLVISATAFHWIKPEIGYLKAAHVLRQDGHIAVFWNLHPTPYKAFFEDVQEVYQRVVPEWSDPRERSSTEQWIQDKQREIESAGLFGEVTVRLYPWTRVFSREDYIKLLSTFSDHQGLDERRRTKLFKEIGSLIDDKYEGRVKRPYLSALFIARKL